MCSDILAVTIFVRNTRRIVEESIIIDKGQVKCIKPLK